MTTPDANIAIALPDFYNGLNSRLKLFEKFKSQTNIFLASDFNVFNLISPDELKLSKIISDLLDPSGAHGQSGVFLDEFLNILGIKNEVKYNNSTVKCECCTDYLVQNRRRIDILVDLDDFAIAIENKPFADEQINQISDYAQHLEKKYKNRFFLVYVSGDGSEPGSSDKKIIKDLTKQNQYKMLRYNPDIINWLKICCEKTQAEKIRWFLKDFVSYIKTEFSQQIEEES